MFLPMESFMVGEVDEGPNVATPRFASKASVNDNVYSEAILPAHQFIS